jgi:hypothetical protein
MSLLSVKERIVVSKQDFIRTDQRPRREQLRLVEFALQESLGAGGRLAARDQGRT